MARCADQQVAVFVVVDITGGCNPLADGSARAGQDRAAAAVAAAGQRAEVPGRTGSAVASEDNVDPVVARIAHQQVAQAVTVDIAGRRDVLAEPAGAAGHEAGSRRFQGLDVRRHRPIASASEENDYFARAAVVSRHADGGVGAIVAVHVADPGHGGPGQVADARRFQPNGRVILAVQRAAQIDRTGGQRGIADVVGVPKQGGGLARGNVGYVIAQVHGRRQDVENDADGRRVAGLAEGVDGAGGDGVRAAAAGIYLPRVGGRLSWRRVAARRPDVLPRPAVDAYLDHLDAGYGRCA